MIEQDFVPASYAATVDEGKVVYRAPSNIALVKYWGKRANQIPANPSISFTLDACATTTTLSYVRLASKNDYSFDLRFEGKPKEDFKPKIRTFFDRIYPYLPFLKEYHFTVETSNSFPHSSGIASSASGMSALALCLLEIERQYRPDMTDTFFNKKASFLARLGSGSASRSIEGPLVQWGKHETIGSSDLYGIPYPYKVHDVFKKYRDTILLVDEGQKQVSSTVGHDLMHHHPFAEQRFAQAHKNLTKLKSVFEKGDVKNFVKIVESEALTLHAMMLASMPYFILMKPNTLEIINRIRAYRKRTETPVCFTLDAGANVHVLYPETSEDKVDRFIRNELVVYCQNGKYICDRVAYGAKKM